MHVLAYSHPIYLRVFDWLGALNKNDENICVC